MVYCTGLENRHRICVAAKRLQEIQSVKRKGILRLYLACVLEIIAASIPPYYISMIHMLYVLLIHIGMDQFEITISMVNYLLYVIIIMLIYGIKIIRKMPIILTYLSSPKGKSDYQVIQCGEDDRKGFPFVMR